jgi:hypothetical protein
MSKRITVKGVQIDAFEIAKDYTSITFNPLSTDGTVVKFDPFSRRRKRS